ncbi:MAG: TlpA disulfide reductase family protein [Solirubrobacteraceae bacterium]
MTPRRLLITAVLLATAALLVVGLIQLGGSSAAGPRAAHLSVAEMQAQLAGSSEPFAAVHRQANELLPGGLPALRARLAQLRGRAVVINKWASWCGPCRSEFGVFQRVALTRGRTVAFLGIDSRESSRGEALAFMRTFPVSYPSYYDHSGGAGETITDSTNTPVTVFRDSAGGEYIHQGPYISVAELERDVARYALGV